MTKDEREKAELKRQNDYFREEIGRLLALKSIDNKAKIVIMEKCGLVYGEKPVRPKADPGFMSVADHRSQMNNLNAKLSQSRRAQDELREKIRQLELTKFSAEERETLMNTIADLRTRTANLASRCYEHKERWVMYRQKLELIENGKLSKPTIKALQELENEKVENAG